MSLRFTTVTSTEMHTYSLSIWKTETGDLCKFQANLVKRMSSRPARARHLNPDRIEKKEGGGEEGRMILNKSK